MNTIGVLKGDLLPQMAKGLVEGEVERPAREPHPDSRKLASHVSLGQLCLKFVLRCGANTRALCVSIILSPEMQGWGPGSTALHAPACAPLGLGRGQAQ